MSDWMKACKCKECGAFKETIFDAYSCDDHYICECCGAKKSWLDSVVKVVSDAVWWKPWTWFSWHYQEHKNYTQNKDATP